MKRKYNHIFFDLDHTLWDFDSNAHDALVVLFREFSLSEIVKGDFRIFYERYLHHNELLWNRYHKGFISQEDLKWKRMWRTLLDFKVANEKLAKDLSQRFLELLPANCKLFPYTIEVLEYLKEGNYELHLITNGFEKTQRTKIRNSGLEKYFGHVITSEVSNSLKPKKEIFDYAFAKCNACVSSSLMVGDNPEADILGAINAGMDSVHIIHDREKPVSGIAPTYTIYCLSELKGIL